MRIREKVEIFSLSWYTLQLYVPCGTTSLPLLLRHGNAAITKLKTVSRYAEEHE